MGSVIANSDQDELVALNRSTMGPEMVSMASRSLHSGLWFLHVVVSSHQVVQRLRKGCGFFTVRGAPLISRRYEHGIVDAAGRSASLPGQWARDVCQPHGALERAPSGLPPDPGARRLLVSWVRVAYQKGTLQVAHGALLCTWPTLRVWLEESRLELEQKRRVKRICDDLTSVHTPQKFRLVALSCLESLAEDYPGALQAA